MNGEGGILLSKHIIKVVRKEVQYWHVGLLTYRLTYLPTYLLLSHSASILPIAGAYLLNKNIGSTA